MFCSQTSHVQYVCNGTLVVWQLATEAAAIHLAGKFLRAEQAPGIEVLKVMRHCTAGCLAYIALEWQTEWDVGTHCCVSSGPAAAFKLCTVEKFRFCARLELRLSLGSSLFGRVLCARHVPARALGV